MGTRNSESERWISVTLYAAGVYNLAWGSAVVLWPRLYFEVAGMAPPNYPELWQCIGMIVGVYGVGYAIAAADPRRHWPIIFVGLLGKVLGPIGFVQAAWQSRLPWIAGLTILANDVVWWLPFAAVLLAVHRRKPPGGGSALPPRRSI